MIGLNPILTCILLLQVLKMYLFMSYLNFDTYNHFFIPILRYPSTIISYWPKNLCVFSQCICHIIKKQNRLALGGAFSEIIQLQQQCCNLHPLHTQDLFFFNSDSMFFPFYMFQSTVLNSSTRYIPKLPPIFKLTTSFPQFFISLGQTSSYPMFSHIYSVRLCNTIMLIFFISQTLIFNHISFAQFIFIFSIMFVFLMCSDSL